MNEDRDRRNRPREVPDDLDISLGPSRGRETRRADPPDRLTGVAVASMGDPDAGGLRVYVSRRACEDVERHAYSDTSREVGGVLLGRHLEGPDGPFVQIEEAMIAEAAESRAARITFTHETWARLAERMEQRGDDLQIVGWYHTHPGFGIFLSHHDLFIHRNFFTEPWQVALVVDPVAGERGFFLWRDGRVHPADAWSIFAPEEEADALNEFADRLRLREPTPSFGPRPVGAPQLPAAIQRRLENVRSYVLLLTITAMLILGVTLVLLMTVVRVRDEVRHLAWLAERNSPLGRGRDLIEVGRHEEAIQELTLARLETARAAEADHYLHTAYRRLKRYDEARAAIVRASSAAPDRYSRAHAQFLADDLRRGTPWAQASRDARAAVRREGLARATEPADAAAGAIAAQVIDDSDTQVALVAVRALRAVGGDENAAVLAEFVAGTRSRARFRFDAGDTPAAAALMVLARAAAPDDLAVEDAYWYYRYKAGLCGLDEVLEKTRKYNLVAALARDGDRRARRQVIEAMANQRSDWIRSVLGLCLRDEDASVSAAALETLVSLSGQGDWQAAVVIASAVDGEATAAVRRACVQALGRSKQAAAVPTLVNVARSPEAEMRLRLLAVDALAELGAAGADALKALTLPDGQAEVLDRVQKATPTADANALYDSAYQQYHAGRPEEAQQMLDSLENDVTDDRRPKLLRRDVARALEARALKSRGGPPESGPATEDAPL